jgi:hypothetical protein
VFFSLEKYFLARILCQKTGGICSHSNLAPSQPGRTDWSDRCLRVVRPVLISVAGPARHTAQTGVSNRSDRCPCVRVTTTSPDRIRLVKEIPCRPSPPTPINMGGRGRLSIIQSIKLIYLILSRIWFCLQTLAFPISSDVLPSSPRRLKVF